MRGPLRPTDPRRLGVYRLESRLGEGGMGTVYLGRDPASRPVAIKVIKREYAYEDEFRARFRSEVTRARQVPPFCTAELLDADAEHETPYLVVEYVDGPSLAEVVADQGPLTGGNLYSVAVGVATALAAIHGAGVIHRDLKPRNVLFSLGTPKVIDFGIARAFEATSQHTGTDQMVGTVAYMAPERFDNGSGPPVGPAADVFAWGAVVTYAGTGRTPFAGDSPVATAATILTQPPNLRGLPEPLRGLVARTLDKRPENRPTAQELLDLLLAAGAVGAPAADGLAGRPELRRVARAAQHSAARTAPEIGPAAPARHSAGVGSRRWRRTAPVLAAVALLGTALAAALAFTPTRDLLLGADAEPGAGRAAAPSAAASAPSAVPPSGGSVPPTRSAAPPGTGRTTAPPSGDEQTGGRAEPDDGPVEVTAAPGAPSPRRCRSADTRVTVIAQSDNPTAPGTQKAIVSVVNESDSACRVEGRVHVGLYNAADERVRVPTRSVDEPDKAADMVLRPGGGAFQGIKWEACDRDTSDCPVGNTLRGSLEESATGVVAALEGFPPPTRSDITMSSLRLGTLQPSAHGTVAW
ncbi:protein kinase domain-containing protein [Jidongwangia harbinensis]|uniref:protein kinase domain-containing protein n=1 Tax=Jidongwangia harbinensis TaxID=2878561 RepID=UPI001CD95874|nr:protein kinase [Jidongwangia harbinensis]MCA2216616.1 protein kinase [Jidongwangia harbinensis]